MLRPENSDLVWPVEGSPYSAPPGNVLIPVSKGKAWSAGLLQLHVRQAALLQPNEAQLMFAQGWKLIIHVRAYITIVICRLITI